MPRPLLRLVLATASLLALASPAAAQGAGPALSVPADRLAQSLRCPVAVEGATRAPVLLVPGTGENPDFFDWNYARAFTQAGVPFCTVTLPGAATDDIQTAAEYLVHAIRDMRARSGRRIAIVGHSQGGMSPRWALKYWPDTRAMVDDLVGLASSNHGTDGRRGRVPPELHRGDAPAEGRLERSSPRSTPARRRSRASPTPPSSRAWTRSSRRTRTRRPAAPRCAPATGGARTSPRRTSARPNASEHLVLGSSDPVGYALAIDALEHDGPADPARIPATVCAQPFQPGVNPATFATDSSTAYARVLDQFNSGSPQIPAEPPLRCYVTATCAGGGSAGSGATATRRCTSRRAFTIRLSARLASARVTVNGRRARVLRGRRLRARIVLRGLPRGTYRVRIVGRTRAGRTLRTTRTYRTCAARS